MTETRSQYWVEVARHPQGYVLYACPSQNLKYPWALLKLMRPGPTVRRRGGGRRIWLRWNAAEQRLMPSVLDDIPVIHDWVSDLLEAAAEKETRQ
jgi:hypothetical protein